MSGRDRRIDPVTRDYIQDGAGGYETTTTIATKMYFQIVVPRNSWHGDPELGSDLHLVKFEGAGEAGRIFAADAVKASLARFVKQGLASGLKVDASADGGRISIDARITDIQGAVIGVVTPFEG